MDFYSLISMAEDDRIAWLRTICGPKSAACSPPPPLRSSFGKKVFVAVLGYPSATMSDPYAWNSALPGYPISPQGAHDFVRDLVAWGGVAGGPLSGVRPWAPTPARRAGSR
ncbi:hypothetical protein ACFYTC_01520 [Actinomadura nitritigenes]|uniref:hypothetical protein n=1 Tax=Actinomadura nitritigenes TaxID=134602 RepID=UPI0036D170BF